MSLLLDYAATIRFTIATDTRLNEQLEDTTYLFDEMVVGIVSIAATMRINLDLRMSEGMVGIAFARNYRKMA